MKPIADFHVHTIASGHAFSTIEELAAAAKKKGLKYLGIAEHGPAMPGGPHEYYFHNLKILPEKIHGVRILKGIEANIISKKGELDLREVFLKRMEIVIASCHIVVTPQKMSAEENTRIYLNVLENKNIDVLGHIENPAFPIKVKEVVGAAKESGKIVEINNASFTVARKGSYDTCVEIMKELKQNNMKVMINSDAHISNLVGAIKEAWQIAKEIGIKKEQVINFSEELTEEFLSQRRSRLGIK
ncbi:phosphatase [Candidatus Margulisiibacteriota bacterium]